MAQSTNTKASSPLQRAVERATGPEFVDDFDWTFVSVDGLSVVDAWAMVTTWSSLLQGHVSVSLDDSAADLVITPNYAWVDLILGSCPVSNLRMAAAAREASLVWRMLAACRGYGASEHPVFWKKLVSELQRPPQRISTEQPCDRPHVLTKYYISDGHGFFDGVAFPRFKLQLDAEKDADTVDKLVRIFCGFESMDDEEGVDAVGIGRQLGESILARLAPLAQASRLTSPVELTLFIDLTWTPEARVNELVAAIHAQKSSTHDAMQTSLVGSPLFKVVAAQLPAFRSATTLNDGRALETVVTRRMIRTEVLHWVKDEAVVRDYILWALSATQTKSSRGGCGVFGYRQRLDSQFYEGVPAICSALPRTRCAHTFQLEWAQYDNDPRLGRHVAWLGYALFHPDTASSTWRKLDISHHYQVYEGSRDPHDGGALPLMAQGNNLAVALGISSDVVHAYYTATIRAGTEILKRKEKPIEPYESDSEDDDDSDDHDDDDDEDEHEEEAEEDEEEQDDEDDEEEEDEQIVVEVDHESILMVVQETTQMDVCVTSTDVATLDEWVCVVVAGYGTAWVHSSAIEKIVARAPGRPCLTAFKAHNVYPWIYPRGELLQLLQLVGESLETLDLDLTNQDHHTTLTALFSSTATFPSLKSLRLMLESETNLWGAWTLPLGLRDLSLEFRQMPDVLHFAQSPLRDLHDLESLHIRCQTPPSEETIREFIEPLFRALPRLQRLQWGGTGGRLFVKSVAGYALSYPQARCVARKLLLPSDVRCFVGGRDTALVESIVALLSVVRYHHCRGCDAGSALGQLNSDLVAQISSFAGTRVPRDLWID